MDNLINKLDETVKSTLSKYEAPFNSFDWAQMESMLDAAPNNNSLRRSNSPAILIAFMVLAVGFILYFVLKPSGTEVKVEELKVDTKVTPTVVTKPKRPITYTMAVTPIVSAIKKDSNLTAKKDTVRVSKGVTKLDKTNKNDTKLNDTKLNETKRNETKTTEKKGTEKKGAEKVTVKKSTAVPTEKKDKASTVKKKEIKTTNTATTTTNVSTTDILDVELDANDLRLDRALRKEALAKKEAQIKKEKALAKKEALKKEKAAKKEVKPVVNNSGSDTVHIDDENDSNRKSLKVMEASPVENKIDTSKSNRNKSKVTTEKKKSKKDRKLAEKDSVIEKN